LKIKKIHLAVVSQFEKMKRKSYNKNGKSLGWCKGLKKWSAILLHPLDFFYLLRSLCIQKHLYRFSSNRQGFPSMPDRIWPYCHEPLGNTPYQYQSASGQCSQEILTFLKPSPEMIAGVSAENLLHFSYENSQNFYAKQQGQSYHYNTPSQSDLKPSQNPNVLDSLYEILGLEEDSALHHISFSCLEDTDQHPPR